MSDFKYLLNCFFSQIQKTLKPMKLRSKQKHVRKYITSSATLCKCCIVEYLKKSFESFNLHLISFESSIKKKGRVLICHLKQNFVDCWKKLLRSVLLSLLNYMFKARIYIMFRYLPLWIYLWWHQRYLSNFGYITFIIFINLFTVYTITTDKDLLNQHFNKKHRTSIKQI